MAIVYQHRRNDSGQVFYIGIGKTIRRAFEKRITQRNEHWHRVVNKHGYSVEITHKNICWEEACSIEKYLIQFWRQFLGKESVTNINDGGEGSLGYRFSDEEKEKMRLAKIGVKLTTEHKAKISSGIKSTSQLPENKERRAAARRGKIGSEEMRKKMSDLQIGGKNVFARRVIDTSNGEIFGCLKDAAKNIGMPTGTLQHQLTGYCKNKTTLAYFDPPTGFNKRGFPNKK